MGVEFTLEPSLEDVLDEGLRRLQDKGTWKVWQFGNAEHFDQESFRSHLHAAHLPQDLLHLLPKDDPKGPERPAEAALRQRMTDLLQQVRGVDDGGGGGVDLCVVWLCGRRTT